MGFKPEEMVLWDFDQPLGGLTEEEIRGARLILWSGFCSVHQLFEPAHIEAFRRDWPQGRVIAHPEASFEVCSLADEVGSTERIIQVIADSPAGTRWLVGTEYNLVNRLNNQFSGEGKVCQFMAPTVCNCSTMYRIDPQHLLWVLENLVAGEVVNRVAVDREEKSMARLALQRMLDASS